MDVRVGQIIEGLSREADRQQSLSMLAAKERRIVDYRVHRQIAKAFKNILKGHDAKPN